MARVNHMLVKKRLDECRSKITDQQFFTSRLLAGHFEDLAMVQSRRYRYNRRVHVQILWEPDSTLTAKTNNDLILINAGDAFVTKRTSRLERYQVVCGFFSHELGHVLYTDFLREQTRKVLLSKGQWFPAAPALSLKSDIENEADLMEYLKADPVQTKLVLYISHLLQNIIEDGYIENKILLKFPGTLGQGLTKLRELHFETIPTVTQLKEMEAAGAHHIFKSIMQMLLCYVKFGEIKYGDEPYSDERIQLVFGLLRELDGALQSSSSKIRFDIVNRVLIRCWPYAKSYCEILKAELSKSGGLDVDEAIAERIKKEIGELIGASSDGEGSGSPIPEEGEEIEILTAIKRTATAEAAELSAKAKIENEAEEEAEEDSDESDMDSENGEDPKAIEATSDSEGKEAEGEDSDESDMDPENGEDPIAAEATSDSEGTEPEGDESKEKSNTEPLHLRGPDLISEPKGGKNEYNPEYEAGNVDNSADEIETLLNKMAEADACREVEEDRIRELNEMAQGISYGNIHAGLDVRINRISEVKESLIGEYNRIAPNLLVISKQLQRSLLHALNDRRKGGKYTGLLLGRRLDARSLHRDDGHVFYKNNLPQELPQLAVGLLLDESGSMEGSRATYARASAIILYDFCHGLDVPVMVYGHSTFDHGSREGLSLYSYAEFDDIDGKDKYRLMDIRARDNNRDGAALRFVAERLSKRPEEIKLLIVVSDGQPYAKGYSGAPAEEDMRGIKREYQKKGITFIAAAIGSDKMNIERIYGDSFMDITDLKQLPVKLVSAVKRRIRV